jgi:hypothetical protein
MRRSSIDMVHADDQTCYENHYSRYSAIYQWDWAFLM